MTKDEEIKQLKARLEDLQVRHEIVRNEFAVRTAADAQSASVPQGIAMDVLMMLEEAGMGAIGKPNTLWAMVREVVGTLKDAEAARLQAEANAAALREALLDTRKGEDRGDGLPCWCGSPSYAAHRRNSGRAENGGHEPRCAACRAALSSDTGRTLLAELETARRVVEAARKLAEAQVRSGYERRLSTVALEDAIAAYDAAKGGA